MYTLSQISSDVVDTETRHLQNTSQVCYHYSNVLGEFYIHDWSFAIDPKSAIVILAQDCNEGFYWL